MSEENIPAGRREHKRLLRRRILPDPAEREEDGQDAAEQHEAEQDAGERRADTAGKWALRFLRVLAVLVIALVVFALIRTVTRSRKYTEASVAWENTEMTGTNAVCESFGSDVVKVMADGISCIGRDGTVLWNSGYTMTSPRVCIRGNYGAVADIQSETAVLFSRDGVLGTVNTSLPILTLTISSHGVLALVLDDTDADYITFYDNTGNELDIRIKTKLSGDGYPLDIDLSPRGTGLIASVVYLDQGTMQNQVVFYNFDVGKSETNRMVGYFTYGDTMFAQVSYLSDTVACAFGDDQVNLYSLQNESQPTLIESIPVDREILSVLTGENRVGIITQGEESVATLTVYNSSGREIFTTDIDFDYTCAEFCDENTVIYNGTQCLILGGRGGVRFEGTLEGDIQKLVYTGENSLLMFGSSCVRRLRLR